MAPLLSQSPPPGHWTKGMPLWSASAPSAPATRSSSDISVSGLDGKTKRLMACTPPWRATRRRPPISRDAPGKAAHPALVIRTDPRAAKVVPLARQQIAGRALLEAATAVLGIGGQRLFAIAHHHRHALAAHELDGFLRLRAIGGEVARTQHGLGSDTETLGLGKECLRRLKIAVGPAEDEKAACDLNRYVISHVRNRSSALKQYYISCIRPARKEMAA